MAFGLWPPDAEVRQAIWSIDPGQFGLDKDQDRPNDSDWTGSDIRNVCDLAFRLRCPLTRAATYIVPVAKSDPAAITRLEDNAHGKFLSVSQPGAFKKAEKSTERAVSI